MIYKLVKASHNVRRLRSLAHRRGKITVVLLWLASGLLVAPVCQAQQNLQHTQNNRDLGLRSDLRIDPATLGMSLVIPLGSYPGRAGLDFPVALYYNSKVWRVNYEDYVNGNMVNCVNNPVVEVGTECYTVTRPLYAEQSVAGWTFSSRFPIIESGGERYNTNGSACCYGDLNQGTYIARLTVRFPNGATHELRRSDAVLSGADPYTGTYYAVDSSRLKYVATQSGAGRLYLPDGSYYEIQNSAATKLVDRNGNIVLSQTDTLGRQIVAPTFHNGFVHTESHSLPGVNGTTLTYTFELEALQDALEPDLVTGTVPVLHRVGDMDKFGNAVYAPSLFQSETGTRVIDGAVFNPIVLRRIILPNGTSFSFTYNQYGEIARVVYPTGGYERFRYGSVTPLAAIGSPYAQANRGVLERRISASGAGSDEVSWQYSSTGTVVTMTAPDGSTTVRYLLPSAPTGTVVFGLEDPRAGMVYEERIFKPAAQGGAMIRRTLSNWDYSGPLPGGQATAKRNPRVNRTVGILLDTGGNALAVATELTYDAELNVTSRKHYDFVALSPATAQTATIASIPNGNLLRTEETDYLTNDNNYRERHLLALPTAMRLRDGNGNLVAQSSVSYDEPAFPLLAYGAVTGWVDLGTSYRGNATTVKSWLNTLGAVTNSNAYLATHTQYDQCGSVRKIWDARDTALSNPAQIEYSHQFAYPTLNTSPDPDGSGPRLSLTTATEYDVATGLVTATVDPNGQRTTFSYADQLNRLTQVVRAAADTAAKNQSTYAYDDSARTITGTSDLNTYGDNLLKTVTVYDGLGRTSETRTFEGGTNYIATQQQYDNLGRVFKTSNPFRPQGESAAWTTQTFDALGRVLSVTTPDNAVVTTSYSGNSVTVIDQAGKARKSVSDALGRLLEVYEDPSGVNYQTSYLYDVLDNLVKVTQGSQQRFFMYDSLKRLIRARNPEQGTLGSLNLSDPITGNSAWSMGYQYDANGNLTQRTDARGVVATYVYDALNRNTTIDYSDTTSINPDVKRFYDGAINGIGRFWYNYKGGDFSTASNVEHTAIDSYDALGRPLVQRQLFKLNGVWGPTYQTSRTYNRAGAVTSETYPSGHTVTYTYDAAGRTRSFSGYLGDGANRSYANDIDYSPFGGVRQEQFGTQIPLYHKKHYNKRGQLFDIRLSTVSWATDQWNWNRGAIVNYYSANYAWEGDPATPAGPDNNGNVLRQQHWIPADDAISSYNYTQDTYTYDSLNRIQSAVEVHGSPAGQSVQDYAQMFAYDRWGNRTINPASWGVGINTKQFSVDTATNRLGVPAGQSGAMTYDSAGNLITDTYTGAGNRTYDAENRMTTAADYTGQVSRYTYDTDGKRVRRQVASSQEDWQIYGMDGELLAEYRAGVSPTAPEKEYGYRNGQLLVTATGRFNVALAANGAVATASSAHTCCGFSTTGAINGNNRGPWGSGEGWNDATPNSTPDWIQVDFAGSKTIDEINVFSLHDNYTTENTPTETQTFTLYGLLSFDVQYWNGSTWVTVPGGSVIGNNKVWRKFTFAPITTSKIRVWINAVPDSWSRVVEIQAFGTSAGGEKIQWLVSDQLGTPRMVIDQTGTLANLKRHDYLPFGEELYAPTGGRTLGRGYTSADGVRQQLTQKERDNETGLDYFLARYYSSTQGRFTSVDPVIVTPERFFDPQQFNLYAYTRNNPLRFIDPTGKTLTISGDLDEVKKQLAQILGTDDAAKRIKFNEKTNTITVDLTGIDLTKNEGASLLSDAISSNKVYDVKIGTSVDTKGGEISLVPQLKGGGRVENESMVNLDNNPDVRYKKGDKNMPKNGVDDQMAFNYDWRDKHSESNTKLKLAPNWTTTFHELAEAYAKVDGSMQYAQAHQKAIDRETKLRDQRPYLKDYNPGSGPGTNIIIKQ